MAKTGKRKIVNKSKKVKRSQKIKRINRKSRKNIKKGGGEKTCTEQFNEDQSFNLSACLESQKIEKERLKEIEHKRKIAEENEKEFKTLLEEYKKKKEEGNKEVFKPKDRVEEDMDNDDVNSDNLYNTFSRWLFLYKEAEYKKFSIKDEYRDFFIK